MIQRNADEIRVVRDEWRMWAESAVVAALGIGLAIYGFILSSTLGQYALASIIFLGSLVFVFLNYRQRGILVIRNDEIGWGFVNGRMWWKSRGQIGSVVVTQNIFQQILLYGPDGTVRGSHVFRYHSIEDLRSGFEEAGICVRSKSAV